MDSADPRAYDQINFVKMIFSVFYNEYDKRSLAENLTAFYALLGEELSSEIKRDYDVVDLLLDLLGKLETAWRFPEIMDMQTLLGKHNPDLYEEMLPYVNETMVKYYCFHDDREGIEQVIADCKAFPLVNYDMMALTVKRMIPFQHQALAIEVVDEVYEAVRDSEALFPGAEKTFSQFKLWGELEKVYARYLQDGDFVWTDFQQTLQRFDMRFQAEIYMPLTEAGFTIAPTDLLAQFEDNFSKANRPPLIHKLSMRFMAHMKERGMGFLLSAWIWSYLDRYWSSKKTVRKHQGYFGVQASRFKAFLLEYAGRMLDYRFCTAMILWGSAYVYDFLFECKLINQAAYEQARTTFREYKEALIRENLPDLWEYDFVNRWPETPMVKAEEQAAEKEIFRAYYGKDKKETAAEQQAGFFIDPSFKMPQLFAEEDFFRLQPSEEVDLSEEKPPTRHHADPGDSTYPPTPIRRAGPKIGRNEKVTVKYQDGKVVENVKFKKIKADLEKGLCELVER